VSDPIEPSSPPFLHSFLQIINRLRAEARPPDPIVWQQRAQQLLPVRHPQQKVSTSFGLGTVGLISEHTHYFPGFALVIPLPVGVGVALRGLVDLCLLFGIWLLRIDVCNA